MLKLHPECRKSRKNWVKKNALKAKAMMIAVRLLGRTRVGVALRYGHLRRPRAMTRTTRTKSLQHLKHRFRPQPYPDPVPTLSPQCPAYVASNLLFPSSSQIPSARLRDITNARSLTAPDVRTHGAHLDSSFGVLQTISVFQPSAYQVSILHHLLLLFDVRMLVIQTSLLSWRIGPIPVLPIRH